MNNCQPVIAIVGPTASGKSDLGVNLALEFNGEIISADSRQVYRGLDLGSGKITKAEMKGVSHHLLDVADPRTDIFTVSDFQESARQEIMKIHTKSKIPFLVGGTGFYLNATLYDLKLPAVAPNDKLRQELEQLTTEQLFERLLQIDPDRAALIDRHNRRRLVRAIEISEQLGSVPCLSTPIPSYHELIIGLQLEPEKLRERITVRLDNRLAAGLIEEVHQLNQAGVSWERLDSFGLEYRYISRFLLGQLSKQQMREKLLLATFQYAKRQMTWFKRNKDIVWISEPERSFGLVRNFLAN